MREVKFRAIQNNKILGYIATDPHFNGGCFYQLDNALSDEERYLESTSGIFPQFRNDAPLTKTTYEQYTGLKDKNGKEIYEGDILVNNSNRACEVYYHQLSGSWDAKIVVAPHESNARFFAARDLRYLEIIGNIHEVQND